MTDHLLNDNVLKMFVRL